MSRDYETIVLAVVLSSWFVVAVALIWKGHKVVAMGLQ